MPEFNRVELEKKDQIPGTTGLKSLRDNSFSHAAAMTERYMVLFFDYKFYMLNMTYTEIRWYIIGFYKESYESLILMTLGFSIYLSV